MREIKMKQNGFFSIAIGLAMAAIFGAAGLAVDSVVSEDQPAVAQQQETPIVDVAQHQSKD